MRKNFDKILCSQVRINLFSWIPRVFIIDPKNELWAMTADWRQKHIKNKVLRFETTYSNFSICWNPLDEINDHD